MLVCEENTLFKTNGRLAVLWNKFSKYHQKRSAKAISVLNTFLKEIVTRYSNFKDKKSAFTLGEIRACLCCLGRNCPSNSFDYEYNKRHVEKIHEAALECLRLKLDANKNGEFHTRVFEVNIPNLVSVNAFILYEISKVEIWKCFKNGSSDKVKENGFRCFVKLMENKRNHRQMSRYQDETLQWIQNETNSSLALYEVQFLACFDEKIAGLKFLFRKHVTLHPNINVKWLAFLTF